MDINPMLDFIGLHPFIRQTVQDRLNGTILGAALGDAVGLYTEFLSKDLLVAAYPEGNFRLVHPATELRNDGHRNKFTQTAWTDDTDHALLIILSYLHHNGHTISPTDLATRLRFWCGQGLRCLDRMPMGLGQTVGRVVLDEHYLQDPVGTAYRYWAAGGYKAAANGSLMRTHPLGVICIGKSLEETFRIAVDFSVITHPDPRCVVSCCLTTALIRGILRGDVLFEAQVDELTVQCLHWVDQWINEQDPIEGDHNTYPPLDHTELRKHIHATCFEELELDDGRKMGYVYKALGAGILCLRLAMRHTSEIPHSLCEPADREGSSAGIHSNNLFERLITALVLQGGDADTNACVAGSLLGAFMGFNSLPSIWRDGMMHSRWLLGKCYNLSEVIGVHEHNPTSYSGKTDPDTLVDGGKNVLSKDELDAREKAFMEAYMAKTMRIDNKKEKGWIDRVFGGS